MAQQNIWDGEAFVDPNDPRYRDLPAPPQAELAGGDYDLDAFYRRAFNDPNRTPDANERSTDLANIAKYGKDAFEQDFLSRRPNNTPQQAPQQATSQYSSSASPSSPGVGDNNLSQLLSTLQQRDSREQQQQQAMREILMSQLTQAQQPVSVNAPGIREVLAGGRLGLQRGAERERRNAAEMRAYDGSGGLGGKAFDSDVSGILQRQGEAEARMTGDVLGGELQAKRDQVQRLLTLAMQLGDAESARTLQAQLAAIQTQMQQSNFYDDSAFRYAQLNSNNNLQTLLALLNAA
jgi:hypothetical protein